MPYTLMDTQRANAQDSATVWRSGDASGGRRVSSGRMLDAYGMMCDVLVEIREDQQQLEHAITLFRLRFVRALFQIFDRRERVRKQPFQAGFGKWGPFTATLESLIGTQERFVEKMIQAESCASERRRRGLRAPRTGAVDGYSGFHRTPLILERLLPRGWGESSTKFLRASYCEL
jgi:hypothetical protein